MKYMLLMFLFLSKGSFAQQAPCENIIIITTDGYRWQELFSGADSSILFNTQYVNDTAAMRCLYWDNTVEARRKKLMPFTWNYINANGQIWGNRNYGNLVSVNNPYRLSYAGYNEIFTGYADRSIIANKPKSDNNSNLLTFLNTIPGYEGKVAVFGSWNLFSYILNGTERKIKLNAGYQQMKDDSVTTTMHMINGIQQWSSYNERPTRSDMLTFTMAMEYMQTKHPKVVHIGFGETDEYAHKQQYDKYLSQANQFDKFLSEIWAMLQEDDFYKGKTTLFITTDHGRGKKLSKWSVHGPLISGSEQTWMMQMGPGILPLGEIKERQDISNEQFAQTIAGYLGKLFIAEHPVASAFYSFMYN